MGNQIDDLLTILINLSSYCMKRPKLTVQNSFSYTKYRKSNYDGMAPFVIHNRMLSDFSVTSFRFVPGLHILFTNMYSTCTCLP